MATRRDAEPNRPQARPSVRAGADPDVRPSPKRPPLAAPTQPAHVVDPRPHTATGPREQRVPRTECGPRRCPLEVPLSAHALIAAMSTFATRHAPVVRQAAG